MLRLYYELPFSNIHSLQNNFRLTLKSNAELRESMAVSHNVNEFRCVVKQLEDKFTKCHNGSEPFADDRNTSDETEMTEHCNLSLPPWVCQPYIRMEPEEHKKLLKEKERIASELDIGQKREYFDEDGNQISRKLSKKLRRVSRRPHRPKYNGERALELCSSDDCDNPMVIWEKKNNLFYFLFDLFAPFSYRE